MVRYNPFRPGSIVTPGMFAGRSEELVALDKVLIQTKNGNPHHFLISGERGIGKSSLLYYFQLIATGKIESYESGSFKFLVVPVELSTSTTYTELLRKIGCELRRTVGDHQRARELAKSAWEFLSRWEAFGVSYKREDRVLGDEELLEELTHTFDRVVTNTQEEFDGVLVLIDEADKPMNAQLGQFVKLFSERLTKRGVGRFSLGLAGLPTVISKLRESHESAPRIFQPHHLGPLEPKDTVYVITKGLEEASEKNRVEITVEQEANIVFTVLSEGYPHFIQQFAYCAFERDSDNVISADDVLEGAFKRPGGAFHQLGVKYFEDLYFDQIGSDEYRAVLQAMSEHSDRWVEKATIRKKTGLRDSTLNNALSALKKRNIIVPKRGARGVYKLPTRSFATWIKGFTQATPVPRTEASQGGVPSTPGTQERAEESRAAGPALGAKQ